MTTRIYTHAACLEHNAGELHPERPARLKAIAEALSAPEFAKLERAEAPRGTLEQIQRAHPGNYAQLMLDAVPAEGLRHVDADTILSAGSGEAALRGVGAVCAAVDAVMNDEVETAFCAIRPPGHHAEAERAMGFCLFNNVAIGAFHARAVHGLHRIAVIDFDVHHGNGTQDIFWNDQDLFFGSTHQMPLYPGSGAPTERGAYGNIRNMPLQPYSGSKAFRQAMRDGILPALTSFAPELLLISAGFDAHRCDPLGAISLEDDDFEWITDELMAIARHACGGRVVSTLEGGYSLEGLAGGVAAHVRSLMN